MTIALYSRRRRRHGGNNSAPNTPTISAGTPTSSGVVLTGSAFSDPDVGDTHAASQWQVFPAADPTSFVIFTGDDATHKTSYTASGLSPSTSYVANVRYKDSAGNYSAWSSNASFTTTTASGTTFTNAIRFSGNTNSADAAANATYDDLAAFTVALLVRRDATSSGIGAVVSKGVLNTGGWEYRDTGASQADFTGHRVTTSDFKRDTTPTDDNSWNWVFIGYNRSANTVTRAIGPQGGSIADVHRNVSGGGAGANVAEGGGLHVGYNGGGADLNMEVRFVGIASSVLTLAQMQAIADDAVSQASLFVDYWKPAAGNTSQVPSAKSVLPALVYANGASLV